MRIFLLQFILVVSLGSCTKNKVEDCKATTGEVCSCYKIYQPVCGCDGITYSNDCFAECVNIHEFTSGSCTVNLLLGTWSFKGFENADNVDLSKPVLKHKYPDVAITFNDQQSPPTINNYSGKSSVNYYGGMYDIKDNAALSLTNTIMTEIAGSVESTKWETTYLNALDSVYLYAVNGNLLLLYTTIEGKKDVMIFVKQ